MPPNKSAFLRDRPGGVAADARGYPPQRAPSVRATYGGQDGRGYGVQGGRDGSPSGEGGGYGRPGLGPAGGNAGQGHVLTDSDFPLEMGGTSKAEKVSQLRPRGLSFMPFLCGKGGSVYVCV